MSAFEYTALASSGRKTRGLTEADSERHARRQLREQGLVPLTVRAVSAPAKPGGAKSGAGAREKLSTTEVVLFTRLLGALLESGLPLDDTLSAIAKQSADERLRRVVLEVRSRVLEGQGLGDALARFPRAFPEVYLATVRAGEQTRLLPIVLQRVADYLERRQEVQQKVRLAMIYPGVLTGVSLLVVTGLLSFVVPEIVKVFEHSAQRLPAITVALLAVSDAFKSHGLLVFGLLAGVGAATSALLRRPGPRLALHRTLLKLPVLGEFYRQNDAGRFARTLGILLDSGLGMLDALDIASKSVVNRVLRDELDQAAARVREGESLAGALARAPHLPPLLVHLAASGESAGELPKMLETAANSSERAVQLRLAVGLNLLEPALILTMGLVVLLIVLAILLPIFEMNQLV
jgi:general secretion pathway protein F